MIELFSDPTIWVGLLTLVLLEIVLGIDNLVFIAILTEKLPPHQRDRARIIGLGLALFMRLGLLSVISWIATLTTPLVNLGPLALSGRDLILLLGGLFLLFKATTELHERMEGVTHSESSGKGYSSFLAVVAQIVVLDAVFSLDAVITAVGMVDELPVMMAAVVISIALMLLASKPLTRFVNAHPTVIVLCLSFLLMIGFSLVAEGLGFNVPKGYLYAAIGFSILIEFFNQVASRNAKAQELRIPLRERAANKVLSLMSAQRGDAVHAADPGAAPEEPQAFVPEERLMVTGVLSLAGRKARSIMTPVSDVDWVDLNGDAEDIRLSLNDNPHSYLPVCRDSIDGLVGVARAKDMLRDLMQFGAIQPGTIKRPLFVQEGKGVIALLGDLRASKGRMVIVKNEFNVMCGVVTPVDVLEAIAGEFPDEDETFSIQKSPERDNLWIASGAADVHLVQQLLGTQQLIGNHDFYATLGGLLTERHGAVPPRGTQIDIGDWRFTVLESENEVLCKVHIESIDTAQI